MTTDLPGFAPAQGQTLQPAVVIDWQDAAGFDALVQNRPFFNPIGTRVGVTTETTVLDAAAGITEITYPALSSPGALEVVSSAAGDTGTFVALVHYIDGEGFYRQGFAPLTGTTPSPVLNDDFQAITDAIRVNHAFVVNLADPNVPHAGRVDLTIASDIQKSVPAGAGTPDGATWSIPRGYRCMIRGFEVLATAEATVTMQVRFPLDQGDPTVSAADTVLASWVNIAKMIVPAGSVAEWQFGIPFQAPTLADVRFRASAGAAASVTVLPRATLIALNPTVDPNPELQPEVSDV